MIFISYSHKDQLFVNRLVQKLHLSGFSDVWIDSIKLSAGDSLIEKIEEGLETSDILISIVSSSSCESKWVKHELNSYLYELVSGKSGKVIPIVIDECEVPFFLKGKLQIRVNELGEEDSFNMLIIGISEQLNHTYNFGKEINAFKRVVGVEHLRTQFLRKIEKLHQDSTIFLYDLAILHDNNAVTIHKDNSLTYKRDVTYQVCSSESDVFNNMSDRVFNSLITPTVENTAYKTNDKILKIHNCPNKQFLYIDWKPENTYSIGDVHTHTYSYHSKISGNQNAFSWINRRYPLPTLKTSIKLIIERPDVENVIFCDAPMIFDLNDNEYEFLSLPLDLNRFFYPVLKKNGNTYEVILSSKELLNGIIIGVYYNGWQKEIQKEKSLASPNEIMLYESNIRMEKLYREKLLEDTAPNTLYK